MNELVKILENINLDLFYCVTIWPNSIELQGHMSMPLIEYCKTQLNIVEFKVQDTNYLQGKINNIKITLT
jgi:hypothetical protein